MESDARTQRRMKAPINIDANPRNADWCKQSWDLPSVNDLASLRAHLRSVGMTSQHFKSLPIYELNVGRPGMEWLRAL